MMRKITCVVCPKGCQMLVEQNGTTWGVTGHGCPRGEKHAISEITNPVRSLTSTVRVSNRIDKMVSVKSATPVAKNNILKLMQKIRLAEVEAPIHIGQVLFKDVYGVDIVATKEIL